MLNLYTQTGHPSSHTCSLVDVVSASMECKRYAPDMSGTQLAAQQYIKFTSIWRTCPARKKGSFHTGLSVKLCLLYTYK
jgi:hypothetical protein